MKENSIEDRINKAYCFLNSMHSDFRTGLYYKEDLENLEHILSDYKRILKENEEIRMKNNAIKRESEAYAEHMIRLDNELNLEKEKSKYEWIRQNCLPQELVNKLYIPIQKIKDIIDRIDYDIKKTKEIISNNQKNNYQITRLKAMNTKSLDIKKRLQELLESEE